MKIEKVAIVGMGALGLLYGEHIAKTCGRDAVAFIMDSERYARHSKDVYTVNGAEQSFQLVSSDAVEPVDLVIVATKYSGLDEAIVELRKAVGPNTILISVLNGITSEEKLIAAFGAKNVIHCVALGMDAVREGTSLTYQHQGMLKIGAVAAEQQPALAALEEFLTAIGLKYVKEDDILHALWAKLLLNVGINQTCMVYETSYGGSLANAEAKASMFAAMHEVIAVAQKEGINLTEADFEGCVKIIQGLSYEGLPSMRQDALAKRKSEVDLFAGTIVELGAKHGVPTPVNKRYYDTIKSIEATY